jgi:D-alanyl-D-alanine carboxypeptidase/D-alanyl-D-alanine-endopeptidase (penicillin-binding protein 4)
VFLTLSAETLKLPARADRSARVVQSWLGEKGLPMPELVLENGSGLSRVEQISAANLGRLLVAAWRSPVSSCVWGPWRHFRLHRACRR